MDSLPAALLTTLNVGELLEMSSLEAAAEAAATLRD